MHSLSGELLRCLKGPDICQHPRLINVSNEGRILVNYSTENGYMAMFSNNGELVNSVKLTDQILVSCIYCFQSEFYDNSVKISI